MRILIRLLAVLTVIAALAPAATADTTIEQTDDRFYLRGTGCGETEDLYLDDRLGTDEYDGCGVIGGLPVNEAEPVEDSLSTRDPIDLVVDADRDLVVTIRAESWFGDGVPGAGQSVVEVSLTGTPVDGPSYQTVNLGSGASEQTVVGEDNATHEIAIDIPDAADEANISGLTLKVTVRGANVNLNNLGMSGDSFFDLPTLTEVEDS